VRERLRQEDGVALLLALGFSIVLSILVFSMTSYVTANQHNAQNSSTEQVARAYAEAALNTAYSRISYANTQAAISGGLSPSKPNLLGCGTGNGGASDCSTIAPLCTSFVAGVSCPSPYASTAGTATIYGYYTGTNPGAFSGIPAAASTWVLVATGYARNASGTAVGKTLRGTVTISAANAGAVASVWNHVFLTAPLVPNVCQASFNGNNMQITVPLYVIGNLCLSGQNVSVTERSGGQPIDLQVGGKLSLSGAGSSVGDYSVNPTAPITSGAVVGGCTSGAITTSTASCTNGTYRYSQKYAGTYVSQSDPELTSADILDDYTSFDPGPNHPCATGGLAAGVFDRTVNSGFTGEPDVSGSVTSGAAFELAPTNSDYTCVSQSGAGKGRLSWNHTTHTLTINGGIFFDSNLTISSNVTYTGTAVIEAAGTVTFGGNSTQVCAVNTSCLFTNWQGSSGHNDMLTLVSLASGNSQAIHFTDNSQRFQGSLWTRPSSGMSFDKNGVDVQGPMSLGSFDASFNNATFEPLPVIKNMPIGAPVPPNVSASISPLNIVG
jgi:Tfp pilus assembly protein PilX